MVHVAMVGLVLPMALSASPTAQPQVFTQLRYSATAVDLRVELNGVPLAHPAADGGPGGGSAPASQWLKPGQNELRVVASPAPPAKGGGAAWTPSFEVTVVAGEREAFDGKTLAHVKYDGKGKLPAEKTVTFASPAPTHVQFWEASEVLKDDAATRDGAIAAFETFARAYPAHDLATISRAVLFQQNEQERSVGDPLTSQADVQKDMEGMFAELPKGAKFEILGRERIATRLVAGGRILVLSGKGAPLLQSRMPKGAGEGFEGYELDGLGYARVRGDWVIVDLGMP